MISLILLAGGVGARMGKRVPKQFLLLEGKPIAQHSLDVFLQIEEIGEIIIVCAPKYRHLFSHLPVKFAPAGERRQDSVWNGLQSVDPKSQWICTHDSARPFISRALIHTLFEQRHSAAAASLAMPVKNTLKEINSHQEVIRTVERSSIWEIQTPQLLKREVLEAGFAVAMSQDLIVTDDVSLAELIGVNVKLLLGSYQNIKITTPEDLSFAEWQVFQKNTVCKLPTMEPAIMAGKSNPVVPPSRES